MKAGHGTKKQGPAREVLVVGEMPDPNSSGRRGSSYSHCLPLASIPAGIGISRSARTPLGYGMARILVVIPHSDGAGRVDQLGAGVPSEWMGRSVWWLRSPVVSSVWYGPRSLQLVPVDQIARLPEKARRWKQGACVGIPGITAHRAVHVAGFCEWTHCVGCKARQVSVGVLRSSARASCGGREREVIGTVRSPLG